MSRLILPKLKGSGVAQLQKVMRIVGDVSEIPWRCEVCHWPRGPQCACDPWHCTMWPVCQIYSALLQTWHFRLKFTKSTSRHPSFFSSHFITDVFAYTNTWYRNYKDISSSKYIRYALIDWSAQELHSLVSRALDFKPEEGGLSPGCILLLVVLL